MDILSKHPPPAPPPAPRVPGHPQTFRRDHQEALRRLRPVRLKLELQPVSIPPSSSGRPSSAGSIPESSASHHSPGLPSVSQSSTPPRRSITGLHLRRKLTLASRHPFSAMKSFGRRLDKRIQMSHDTVLYEDALLVVGTELLDLYLASDGTESEIGEESDGNPSGDGSMGDSSFGGASSNASAALGAAATYNSGASGVGSGGHPSPQSILGRFLRLNRLLLLLPRPHALRAGQGSCQHPGSKLVDPQLDALLWLLADQRWSSCPDVDRRSCGGGSCGRRGGRRCSAGVCRPSAAPCSQGAPQELALALPKL